MLSNDSLEVLPAIDPPDWLNPPGLTPDTAITPAHLMAIYEILLISSSDKQFAQKALRAIIRILGLTAVAPI